MTIGGPASLEQGVLDVGSLDAVVFDLDGVLCNTAALHQQAWSETFSELFGSLEAHSGQQIRPFTDEDYERLVDGELRLDGARNVLSDRHISLEEGGDDDSPGTTSVSSVARAKDERFVELLDTNGPGIFPSSIELVRGLRSLGLVTAVVSASLHCEEVLRRASISDLFDVVIDGRRAGAMNLRGKPAPDTFLEALIRTGVEARASAVIEDAASGVRAGHEGGFRVVIGVDRRHHASDLVAAGADIVVADLGELTLAGEREVTRRVRVDRAGGSATKNDEGVRETLLTLANGYVATRGAPAFARDDGTHYPGTYLAGVYDRLPNEVAGKLIEQESIVNGPNWLLFGFSIDGGPTLGTPGIEILSRSSRLDLRRGLLVTAYRVRDELDRQTSIIERRIVSMANPHLLATETVLIAENWSGHLEVSSGLDASVRDDETIEEQLLMNEHLELVERGEDAPEVAWLATRTAQSHVEIAEASRTRLTDVPGERSYDADDGHVEHRFSVDLEALGRITLEKVVAIYTSHDRAISEPTVAARHAASRAPSFSELLDDHERAWTRLWRRAIFEIDCDDPEVERTLDLHLFHVLQVAAPHVRDLDVGLPPRGLHGEGYLGHIFWDELFVLPVLSERFPEIAQAFLGYRSRRVDAARNAATDAGHSGAMFPWQSGSDGRDETPSILYNSRTECWIPDRSNNQRHVGLAVAYNSWRYFQSTGNLAWLFESGAELILEVARFFASLARFEPPIGRYRIEAVMGPDEFHDGYPWREPPGVDDNAYTNVMTAWVLTRANDLVDLVRLNGRDDVLDRIGWSDDERVQFAEVAQHLHVPFMGEVIAQFEGYERLEPIDLDAYRARYGDISRLELILDAEGDSVRRYQVGKQADALMLFYLFSAEELREVFESLGYHLTPSMIRKTIEYYASRVTHGSSLSRVVHAWVLARLDRASSWQYFREALSADVADTQSGTTREGIHLGAMAGTIDIVGRCYTGLEVRADALWLNPELPEQIRRLAFDLTYRDRALSIVVDEKDVRIRMANGSPGPCNVVVAKRPYVLVPGEELVHPLGS
jgi:HAD superfamily hydrolase (TIGR01509 family)